MTGGMILHRTVALLVLTVCGVTSAACSSTAESPAASAPGVAGAGGAVEHTGAGGKGISAGTSGAASAAGAAGGGHGGDAAGGKTASGGTAQSGGKAGSAGNATGGGAAAGASGGVGSAGAPGAGAGGSGGNGGGAAPTTRIVSLRTSVSGTYVAAGGGTVSAVSPSVDKTELFTLTDLDGGVLADGDFVRLTTSDGAHLSAVNGGGGALLASTGSPGDFETFALVRLAGPGPLASGDAIALRAKLMNDYVSAVNGGGGEVRVDQPHALAWETFYATLDAVVTPPPANAREKVLAYLSGLGGKKTLTGQHDKYNATPALASTQVYDLTGAHAALWSADFGFGKDAVDNRGTMIAEAKKQWSAGAVVQVMYHACAPTGDELCSWDDVGGNNPKHLTDAEWSELVSDGTALNAAWKARLDALAPFFADLRAAGVAPLFRPLHEMNQGVFWWGGRGGPAGTRKLFQLTHDYLVQKKGFDHLIWVWDIQDFGSLATDANDYDPGQAYYDIAALDVYGGGYTQDKYDVMKKVAGSKPIAIGECEHPPSGDVFGAQPDWAFFMLWPDFIAENAAVLPGVYALPRMITREQMPGWK